MTGTEKQIAWAEQIKAAKMIEWNELMAKATGTAPQNVQDAIDWVLGNDDARFWIDNRENDIKWMVRCRLEGADSGAGQRETDKLRRVGQRI